MISRALPSARLRHLRTLTLLPLLIFAVETPHASAQSGSLVAGTPPMGWSSGRAFGCNVTEEVVKAAADALDTNGMARVGYQFVILDDCWQGARDADGFIQPDVKRFPAGMKTLADYVHARGLKFGLTSSAGNTTCDGRPGSRGHEYQDALQFARWGVDYLQYDWCDAEGLDAKSAYTTMRDAWRAANRTVTFVINESGASQPWTWGKTVGHSWRTTTDLAACFACVEENGAGKAWGILPTVDKQDGLRAFAGPGRWNDPGVLQVGNGMSLAEDRAHVSLWAMLAAPLIAGNDLIRTSESTHGLLTNPEVIAVDQDILGVQGFRYRTDGELDVWVRPLSRGQLAVLFLNRNETPLALDFEWTKHRVADDLTRKYYDLTATVYTVRDVWAHEQRGTTQTPLSTTLQSHDVLMLRLTPKK